MTSDVAGSHLPESLYGPCGCLLYREIPTPKSKVVRAELTARRLERIREVDLADNGLILVVDRQVVDHAD